MNPSPDSSSPTRDRVLQAVAQHFPSEDPATVLGILDQYGPERHERERVHLTVLALSRGDLDELRALIAHAKRDYRDVLYWAELAQGHHDPFADRFTEALLTPEATPARLALLTEAVPEATRIAALWNPGYASHPAQMAELEVTARRLGVALQAIGIQRPADLDDAFATMRRGQAEALLLLTSTMTRLQLPGLAERALTNRIPAMGELREFTVAGGLMSYGPSAADRHERAAGVIETLVRTLKREASPEPSVERPVKLDLVINLQTAKALGLAVPRSVLVRVDELVH